VRGLRGGVDRIYRCRGVLLPQRLGRGRKNMVLLLFCGFRLLLWMNVESMRRWMKIACR
jgi:hypothetical protein